MEISDAERTLRAEVPCPECRAWFEITIPEAEESGTLFAPIMETRCPLCGKTARIPEDSIVQLPLL